MGDNKLAIVSKQYNTLNSIVLRSNGSVQDVLNSQEPVSIIEALEAPKLNFLKKQWGEQNVIAVLVVCATDTAKALGFKTEGNERVVGMMVKDFLELYPFYSLEDFMYFFKLIRQRKLGGKTFGKENWEVFHTCLKEYDAQRDEEIERINKEMCSTLNQIELPKAIIDKLSEALKPIIDEENDKQEKEYLFKKVKIEYLKKQSAKQSRIDKKLNNARKSKTR